MKTTREKSILLNQSAFRIALTVLACLSPSGVAMAQQDSWTSVNPMPVKRFDLTTVTGPDGRIYAIGGNYSGQSSAYLPLNHAEVYDPTTDFWKAVAPMPTSRGCPAAAVGHDGLIYVFGGHDRNLAALDTVEVYDPVGDTWVSKSSMPTARSCSAAATGSDGLIYVMGGATGPGAGMDTVEAYNPVTDTWNTQVTAMPTPRYVLEAVAAPDGLIYAIGGSDTAAPSLDTVEAFNPQTGAWMPKPSLNTGRYHPAAAVGQNGHIYVFGGHGIVLLDTVEEYDTNTQSWNFVAPMPTARYDLGAATASDGSIFVIGGYDASGPVQVVEQYTP